MGLANKSALSFKNLPDTSSILEALSTLHAFRGFEVVFD